MSRKQIVFLRQHYFFRAIRRSVLAGVLLLLLVACRNEGTPTSESVITGSSDAAAPPTLVVTLAIPAGETTETIINEPPTPAPPTPTPAPLAATVNGQPILLSTFNEELARFTPPGEDSAPYRPIVLDILLNRTLIELAAASLNITISPETVAQRIAEAQTLANENGGPTGFTDWLTANGFTAESFQEWVYQELLAGAVAEQITANVPYTAEQVRARYIHVNDLALAQNILAQLRNGGDFFTLAQLHSLDTATAPNGGDLDYFPRGTLLIPEIEEVAFALEEGAFSEILTLTNANGQTSYYLVQLIDRDEARPLDSNQRNQLLDQTFTGWLQQQREQADIVILLP
ncbi:MAG: SurA N-terminal domain-containing protein [Anaerolineae bacterium]|nr:SurA N-terminal domain-containing protein [Anaerolineae bacterium]